ncbi:MAG: patatin-like phospholipase family protein [Mycobacteriaceae bacterium]
MLLALRVSVAGAPLAALSDALVASSSAPGSFPPSIVDGLEYVDGAAVSMTNADVLATGPRFTGCGADHSVEGMRRVE